MANVRALYYDSSNVMNRQIADADTVYLGAIDRETAGALTLGGTNATSVDIGKSGITTTVKGDFQVDGTETIIGNVTFQGTTQIGDNPADTIEFQARMATGTDLIPLSDSSSSFGSTSLRYLGAFIDKVTTEEIEDTLGTLVIDSINAAADSTITIQNSDATFTTVVDLQGDLDISETLDVTGLTTLSGGVAVDGGTVNVDVTSDFSGTITVSGTAGINQTGSGQNTFAANVDATSGLDVSGAAFTYTGTAGSWTIALVDSALTQTGSGQVTFSGNVDATGGLDVTGGTLNAVNADFTGTLDVDGATTLNGNVTLGDAGTDTITFTGKVASTVLVNSDGAYDLGDTTNRWGHIYCDNLTVTSGLPPSAMAGYVANDYTAATGGITQYDVVYKNTTNNEVGKAQANAVSTSKVIGIAMETISAASTGEIAERGLLAGVGSGWTAGDAVYLSPSTAGAMTTTVPTTSGQIILFLGFAKNATDLDLNLADPILIA